MGCTVDDLRLLYRNLILGWNRRDAEAMAALYSADGVQIGFDGTTVQTPTHIFNHLDPIFRDHQTASFITIVRDVRMLSPGIGMLRADAGMLPPDSDVVMEGHNAVQTIIASAESGKWQIKLFQNTPAAFDGRQAELEVLMQELQTAADARSS